MRTKYLERTMTFRELTRIRLIWLGIFLTHTPVIVWLCLKAGGVL